MQQGKKHYNAMEKNHAMTIRKTIATSLLAILTSILVGFIPVAGAVTVDFDIATRDSDSAQGDVTEEECAQLDESLAEAMGCDTGDKVIDFTEYGGELEGPDASGYDDALTQSTSAREFIQTIVNFALSFLGLIATVIIIYGGIMYVTSRGDEEMASKGKKTIGYAAMGIVIILGSFAFVNTLIGAGGGAGSEDLGGVVEQQLQILEQDLTWIMFWMSWSISLMNIRKLMQLICTHLKKLLTCSLLRCHLWLMLNQQIIVWEA